jgi:hypothetical protein
MYWSTFNGSNWSDPQDLGDRKTSTSPTLAGFNGKLYIAWKGPAEGRDDMYWSAFDGSNWSDQQAQGSPTSTSPALAGFNGKIIHGLERNTG